MSNSNDPRKEKIGRRRAIIAGILVAVAAAIIITVVVLSGQLLQTATGGP